MPPRRIHTVRFFRPSFSAIHCMAYSEKLSMLALSRADNSIELWQFPRVPNTGEKASPSSKKFPQFSRWIPGNSESSVEALAWAGDRLFSTGLHGLVLEYDLERLNTRAEFAVTSGPSWCMAYHAESNRLAVGTEEGYVCLFQVETNGLTYEKVLDKQEGRVLCMDWHSSGKFLVTGSPDTLRLWNTVTGHPVQRMSTGRLEKNRETIVWSVGITDDLTLVSGDSRGKTCFWNGKTGTLVDAYQTHKADVLAVAVDGKQEVIYSSGVDPNIVHFQPIQRKDGRKKWVKSVHHAVHSHDVRAICCPKAAVAGHAPSSVVLSGGVDTQLLIHDKQSRTVTQLAGLPFGEVVQVADRARLMLMRKTNQLEVWRLGQEQENGEARETVGTILGLESEPEKLLALETRDDETIRAADISRDGQWVGYVSSTRLRAYKLTLPESGDESSRPGIKRLNFETGKTVMELAHLFRFYKDETSGEDCLVTATERGNVQIFKANSDQTHFELSKHLTGSDLGLSGSIAHLVLNPAKNEAVIADRQKAVVILDLAAGKVTAKLPSYDNGRVIALAVHPSGETVVVVYSDNHIVEAHSKNGKYTRFSQDLRVTKQWSRVKNPTRGVVLPEGTDEIILYDSKNVCVIDKKPLQNTRPPVNKSSRNSADCVKGVNNKESCQIRIKNKYEHLLFMGCVRSRDGKGQEFVAVEVKPSAIAEQLPPSLKQKKFGVM